ncbi:hypothetical protein [Andreprevotia chitinilytica]|uniref:hypothetical protein n=1 Tax=Andreprevotia chitinilytica TaxID=396808 RepID=UPI0005506C8C|nr:hypothetical protein [Andreprevotia chitinilytica]
MTKAIEFGDVYADVPDDRILANATTANPAAPIHTEQVAFITPPPEALYQTSTPFQSSLDRIRAMANIDRLEKPWIRNTFLFFFVIFPFCFLEFAAVIMILDRPYEPAWRPLLLTNSIALIICAPYFILWIRTHRKTARKIAASQSFSV